VARPASEEGATLVEFALILPIFAVLLFATIDFGMAFGGYLTMRNGVDAAARKASVNQVDPSCATATNPMICTIEKTVGSSFSGIESGTLQVNFSFPDSGGISGNGESGGDRITVCAQATLHSTTGLTAPFIDNKTIFASSTVRLEQNPGPWSDDPTGSSLTC
jgi:Flp pilus assembly pilin Flp